MPAQASGSSTRWPTGSAPTAQRNVANRSRSARCSSCAARAARSAAVAPANACAPSHSNCLVTPVRFSIHALGVVDRAQRVYCGWYWSLDDRRQDARHRSPGRAHTAGARPRSPLVPPAAPLGRRDVSQLFDYADERALRRWQGRVLHRAAQRHTCQPSRDSGT